MKELNLVSNLVGRQVKLTYENPLDDKDKVITGTVTGYDSYFLSIDTTGSEIGTKPSYAKETLVNLFFIVKINFL